MTFNLFGSGITVDEPPDPQARSIWCNGCETSTRHEQTPDGHWICWCGRDATGEALADERIMGMVEAVARMFLGMDADARRKWFAVLVDLLGPLNQDLTDALGRKDF